MAVSKIKYNNKEIILIEYPHNSSREEILSIAKTSSDLIRSFPLDSVYTLTVFGDFNFDNETRNEFMHYLNGNKIYVKACAAVGINGLKKIIYNSILLLTQRKIKICSTVEEAKRYLDSIN
ncbi:MAG: hypothetical protein A2Y40_00330 [Candidatus Margulisbacteria bacterium GWF2_35_9]|nr:MAG: hypothetical protein A2Y40_00330 [Candidatus Margulisbacteria bacterium GWF2_35_9]